MTDMQIAAPVPPAPAEAPSQPAVPAKALSRRNLRTAGIILVLVAAIGLCIDLLDSRDPIPTSAVCAVTAAGVPLIIASVGDAESVSVLLGQSAAVLITPAACKQGIGAVLANPSVRFDTVKLWGGSWSGSWTPLLSASGLKNRAWVVQFLNRLPSRDFRPALPNPSRTS